MKKEQARSDKMSESSSYIRFMVLCFIDTEKKPSLKDQDQLVDDSVHSISVI